MTQLVLANQLHEQAVADFKVSERFAYSFIVKVKQIRDDRLYKELGFQAFEDYCEKAWNVKRDYMDQRIQIADSLGEAYFADTYRQIGHSKSLLLARMEPEIRQQVETQVDVNDATVKQIKEAERRAQEAERAAQLAQQEAERAMNDRHHFEKLYRNELNRQPQTITKTIEVIPEVMKKTISDLEFQNKNLKAGYQEAKQKLQEYELRNTEEFNEEEARKQREKLQHEADIGTINLRIAYKQFVEKAAITQFMQGAIAFSNQSEKDRLAEMVDAAQQIIDQTKLALTGRKLGVVK